MLVIRNGRLYDPRHQRDGIVADLWIDEGRVVSPPADPAVRPTRVIDATGMVVMPGGVDLHCHIAGPKVNTARKMLPELSRNGPIWKKTAKTRSGTAGVVPSTFSTGYLYAGMGYTTAIDAAIPPLLARHAHEEFADTPILDKAFLTLFGNNQYVMEQIRQGDAEQLRNFIAWTLTAVKGYGVKLVNPGGVEIWKSNRGNAHGLDDRVPRFDLTPRQIVQGVTAAVDALRLPHATHIHCNNLGLPGNAATTLETMKACEGRRAHFTHIQFHSYGGDLDDQMSMRSAVPELAEYINAHPELSVDVGQVLFGATTSMTGDGPLGYYLHRVTGSGKWFSGDLEHEAGCGIVPITYKRKSWVHALQWAVGLEWFLLTRNPWQIALTTDHPNGAAFVSYPKIIAWLMDRGRRQEEWQRLPERLGDICTLPQLQREYSLNEICIITRAAPARMLGLDRKGHLGTGADADITIYQPETDIERMFSLPRYVLKAGEVIVDGGELRGTPDGITWHVAPAHDEGAIPRIEDWFNENYSTRFANFPLRDFEAGPTDTVTIG